MNQGSNIVTWVLAAALVVALMVIAFLVGRQSLSSTVPASQVAAPSARATEEEDLEAPSGDVSDEERAAVRAYFAEIDAIQAGPSGMSPNAYAQQLLAEATTGNSSGFDALLSDLKEAQKKLAHVSPPPPCAEYHALVLSTAGDAQELLTTLRSALGGPGNPEGVESITGMAQAAQEKQARLQKMRAALERRYDIRPAAP